MPDDAFKVGVTRDVRRPDGTFVFAPASLSALDDDPRIVWELLPEDRRELPPEYLRDLDGLFHFSPVVSAASLDGVERLVLIARQGVGLDFIDLDACTERGIAVTITPGGITRPMASAAVALVLALTHRLVQRHELLRAGRWAEGRHLLGLGLTGRTLGVVGYGRIGREVVRLLAPYEMRVVVTTRSDPRDESVERVPLDTLLENADVVVLACPLTPETHHLLDAGRLALMKRGAYLVNVARGAVVDQAALVAALDDGRLAGAGLDVFDPEPVAADDPILGLESVIGTPHALGYSDQLFRDCVGGVCAALQHAAAGRVPDDVANPAVLENPLFRKKLARFERRES
jgi:D-3-phosphoglycerate dehydrogenase